MKVMICPLAELFIILPEKPFESLFISVPDPAYDLFFFQYYDNKETLKEPVPAG
jgi:hypothetical protein